MRQCPLDYMLCCQPVTVYRYQNGQVLRQVAENCHFIWTQRQKTSAAGTRRDTDFLLIMPGDVQRVFPGDRVFDGIGPEITGEQWPSFLPVQVAGLAEVGYVTPCYWEGQLCHIEAGRK